MTLSALNYSKPPHFLYFVPPFIVSQRVNLETSNLVHWRTIASPTLPRKNIPWDGRGQGQLTRFRIFAPHAKSPQRLALETSNFVHGSAMRSLSLVMSECSLRGRGQGHVSNFYIVDLDNFATASRLYTGDIHNSTVVGLFMTPIRQWKRLECVTVECICLLHIGPP